MKLVSFGLRLVLPLLACSVALAQGQLWIVDKAGGPGVDFTEIQDAINFASDGDTIQVATGNYAPVEIDGRSLVLLGVGGSARLSKLVVRNLGVGQEVVMRDFGSWDSGGVPVQIAIEDNQGVVWLDKLSVLPGLFFLSPPPPVPTLTIRSSSDVVIQRSTFFGVNLFFGSGNPTDAIDVLDSAVHFYGVTGVGGDDADLATNGLRMTNSFVFASGCSFQGGDGADWGVCDGGSPGGAGLANLTHGMAPFLLETTLTGGDGGCPGETWCFCAPDGPPSTGGVKLLSGYAREYELLAPAPAGGVTWLLYGGVAGDLVFSLIALEPDALFVPALAGTLALTIPPLVISHGPAGGNGQLALLVPIPPLPPGMEALTVFAQGAAITGVGAVVLAAPCQVTIL